MEKTTRIKAEEYFHKPPVSYSCSQAVLLGFREEFGVTERDVEEFARYRGGLAPEGYCGALYAANTLLARRGLGPVTEEFRAVAGAAKCREIKGSLKIPCVECVRLADSLVAQKLGLE